MWQLGNKAAKEKLLENPRVNFYTLYAYESVNKKFFIKNKIIYNSVKKPKYNQYNPWDVLKFWDELKRRENLFSFAKELDSNKSIALKAIVLDKAFKYKYNIYITPKMYNDENVSFKAFVYAIARQESRFIPASVSRSYALGTMQLMPFLVRDYHSDVFEQFNYTENVKLGAKHLKWLFSKLHDPLMVAYAYNGGIGFLKNKVLSYFKYKGKYQPFLSMELVPYDESREYGKKVIANFIIYSHIFGDNNITLHKELKR
jgi:soluble lytic murein transglycosylase